MPNASFSTLRHRRDAVRRAGRVRDDPVLLGPVLLVVDAEDERHIRIGGRCGDDDYCGPRVEMELSLLPLAEVPRRLQHDVDFELSPRQVPRVRLAEDRDREVAGHQLSVALHDAAWIGAVDRIVSEEHRHARRIAHIVDRDDVDRSFALDGGAEEDAPDPAEAVDCNAHTHFRLLCSSERIVAPVAPGGIRTDADRTAAKPQRGPLSCVPPHRRAPSVFSLIACAASRRCIACAAR